MLSWLAMGSASWEGRCLGPVQQTSGHSCPQSAPRSPPPHLTSPSQWRRPSQRLTRPRWVCEVGAGWLLQRELVGELDRDSLTSLGSQGTPPTPALNPPPSLPPHHPATALPSPASGPHPCLNLNWCSTLLTSPLRSWQEKQGGGISMREVGSG